MFIHKILFYLIILINTNKLILLTQLMKLTRKTIFKFYIK